MRRWGATSMRSSFWDSVMAGMQMLMNLVSIASSENSFCARWRLCARNQGVDRLIERIYAETGFLAQAGALPGGASRQQRTHARRAAAGPVTPAPRGARPGPR